MTNSAFNYLKQLNWKLFVIGFVAGFIGIVLTKGGVHLPESWSILHGISAASMGK